MQRQRLFRSNVFDWIMIAAHIDSSSNQNKSYVVSYDCDVTNRVMCFEPKLKWIESKQTNQWTTILALFDGNSASFRSFLSERLRKIAQTSKREHLLMDWSEFFYIFLIIFTSTCCFLYWKWWNTSLFIGMCQNRMFSHGIVVFICQSNHAT